MNPSTFSTTCFYVKFLVDTSEWIYKNGGYGVEPKIVYRYGNVDGKFFDPWKETFENSIQKPVFKKKGEYIGIGSRWVKFGTPEYE